MATVNEKAQQELFSTSHVADLLAMIDATKETSIRCKITGDLITYLLRFPEIATNEFAGFVLTAREKLKDYSTEINNLIFDEQLEFEQGAQLIELIERFMEMTKVLSEFQSLFDEKGKDFDEKGVYFDEKGKDFDEKGYDLNEKDELMDYDLDAMEEGFAALRLHRLNQ